MKLRGMSSSLALLLSLILNAGILLLGIKLYQSQTIALSQVAGSQVSTAVFTMEIIASSPQLESESSLKELDDLEEVLEERLEKIFEKDSDNESTNNSEDHGEKQGENSLSTIEEEIISAKKSDRKIQMPAKLSDIETVEKIQAEHEKREQAESSKNVAVKPQTNIKEEPQISVKENLQKIERKEPIRKQSENQSLSTATQTRSGDEFAAELADKIYSQIEGCYPEASKRRGEEGIVRLKIINHHNQLSVEMIQSSGFSRLDRCAISAVEKLLKSIDSNIVPVAIEGIELKPIRFQLR